MFGQELSSISFDGLTRTRTSFLLDRFNSKQGEEFDFMLFEQDIKWLERQALFFQIDTAILFTSTGVRIEVKVQEANYIYPIVYAEGFKDVFKSQLGFNDINFRGRFDRLGLLHQFYDRHSFSLFYERPYINRKWGWGTSLNKYSTVEPFYWNDTVSHFNFDNYSLQISGHRWLSDLLKVGINLAGFKEYYLQRDEVDLGFSKTDFEFLKYQVKLFSQYSNVQYHMEKLDGFQLEGFLETVQTKDVPLARFFRVNYSLKYFKTLGQRMNIALQVYNGWSSNRESPFSPYVVDGFINARGIGNRIERGTAQIGSNTEFRVKIFANDLFITQGVIFQDLIKLRKANGQLFSSETELYHSSGLGCRINLRKYYKTVLRVDYSLLNTRNKSAFSYGFNHFF
jgi:outer membrane protein insertion porin family